MITPNSKLEVLPERQIISIDEACKVIKSILLKIGCSKKESDSISDHLVDTSLCGMESHGVMRVLQYAEQFQAGYMKPNRQPKVKKNKHGAVEVDGDGGIGITAMNLAYKKGISLARKTGISALSIRNVGHTGRHGAFADWAAEQGFLTIMLGGGNRKTWRQVAPHGGTKALLPTNPYCIGIPGGNKGPVILDFATSKIAGGWLYAAKSAGAMLPENCIIDSDGNPTRDPAAYFQGGAILPAGAHKGYALALVAELIGEAMLGPATTECNWFLISVDTQKWRCQSTMKSTAEDILTELRESPPREGFKKVEIPGEREREHRELSNNKIAIPPQTWDQIIDLDKKLNK